MCNLGVKLGSNIMKLVQIKRPARSFINFN